MGGGSWVVGHDGGGGRGEGQADGGGCAGGRQRHVMTMWGPEGQHAADGGAPCFHASCSLMHCAMSVLLLQDWILTSEEGEAAMAELQQQQHQANLDAHVNSGASFFLTQTIQ